MKVCVLASGSKGNSTYVETGQVKLLIDAGMNCKYINEKLNEIEVTIKDINYVLINPKMISHSEELIYASEGEGCLSVNREVEGIVPRYARVTFTGYDLDGNPIKYRAREELSIAFQHEMDHLNGILFIDHIDPLDPYKNKDYMREI